MTQLSELRTELNQRKGQLKQIQSSLTKVLEDLSANKTSLRRHEKARTLIMEAGLKTQESLSYHIGEITTLALEAVFEDPYELKVEFLERRNKTECDLYFERDGERIEPMDASGGGAVDIAAFALRIASWSMMHPKLRNTIILDEPMKNLSKDMQEKASLMLQEISKKLGIQFIIVTHEETLTKYADRVFMVEKAKKKKVSKVSLIEKDDEPEYRSYQDDGKSTRMHRTK